MKKRNRSENANIRNKTPNRIKKSFAQTKIPISTCRKWHKAGYKNTHTTIKGDS